MVSNALLTAPPPKKKVTGAQKIFCRSSSESHVMKVRPWAGAECFLTCARMFGTKWNMVQLLKQSTQVMLLQEGSFYT